MKNFHSSAFYFLSFTDANQENKSTINGSLGTSNEYTWKPWKYEDRIKNAKEIEDFKSTEVNGKLSTRNKILDKMRKLKCRQEFEPLLGKLIDKAYAEPLHNSNNAWQQFNLGLLEEAVGRSAGLQKSMKYKKKTCILCLQNIHEDTQECC